MKERTKDWLFGIGTGLIALSLLVLLAAAACNDIKHPCVEWEPSTCSSMECAMWTTMTVGDSTMMTCAWYDTRHYPCNVCVRRKP